MICAYYSSTTSSIAREWQLVRDKQRGIDSVRYRGTRGYYPTPGVSAKYEDSKLASTTNAKQDFESPFETEETTASALNELKQQQYARNRKVVNPKYRGAVVSSF